jgi:[ribosomal protein S5]-alanine N-acetyltransferase
MLRPLERGDKDAWFSLRARNRAWLRPWEATEPPGRIARPLAFRAMLREEGRQWRRRHAINMVIILNGELVGRVCLTGIEWGSARNGSLGYWIDQDSAGQGIVPRAVALLTEFAFREGVHRVEIAARPENESSLRVAKKLGFRDEGIRKRFLYIDGDWRDHRVYALTSGEKRVGEYWRCPDEAARARGLA